MRPWAVDPVKLCPDNSSWGIWNNTFVLFKASRYMTILLYSNIELWQTLLYILLHSLGDEQIYIFTLVFTDSETDLREVKQLVSVCQPSKCMEGWGEFNRKIILEVGIPTSCMHVCKWWSRLRIKVANTSIKWYNCFYADDSVDLYLYKKIYFISLF